MGGKQQERFSFQYGLCFSIPWECYWVGLLGPGGWSAERPLTLKQLSF